MNEQRENRNEAAVDPQVAASYAKFADEVAPADLDRAVLRAASQAARSGNGRFPVMPWMRPVAIAATAVLSFALVIDYMESGLLPRPDADVLAPAPATGAPVPPAAESVNRSAADTASALRREKAAASVAAKTTAPQPAGDENSATADASADFADAPDERRTDAALQAEAAVTAARQAAAVPTASGSTGPVAPGREAPMPVAQERQGAALELPRQCDATQRAEPGAWWLCIEALRAAGMQKAADAELESLRAAFPAYSVPE